MTDKLNRCYFQAASAGTGDFVYASTVAGFLSPDEAGATDGDDFQYIAENGSPPTEWEIGTGTFDAGSTTLVRTSVTSSSDSGSPVTFSAAPRVRMGVVLAADFDPAAYVQNVVAGTNVTVDDTDPVNPVVSVTDIAPTTTTLNTDNAAPVAVDLGFDITEVTTDGSGLSQVVTLAALPTNFTDEGRRVSIVLTNRVDGSDSVVVTASGESVTLSVQEQFATYEWRSAEGAWILLSADYGGTGNDYQVWVRYNGHPKWILPPREASFSNEYVDLAAGGNPAFTNDFQATFFSSDGTGTPNTLTLADGSATGLRKLIALDGLVDPGDAPTLDVSNIVDDADAQPASIIFADQNEIFLEWQRYRDSGSGKWVIIGASAGLVTP